MTINVILCDEKGNPTGEYAERELAHTGNGKKHLAITILVYNSKGKVLLQLRKHRRFDMVWDLTGATDLHHLKNGKDESFEDAANRCLEREYNIKNARVKYLGVFNYYAPDGKFSENENCALFICKYDGDFILNPEVGYDYKWMDKVEFLKDITENSSKYSPWAIGSIPFLKKENFFK